MCENLWLEYFSKKKRSIGNGGLLFLFRFKHLGLDADLTGCKDAIERLRFRLIKLKVHGWCARLLQQILGRAD